jgi:hypothetical protein
MSETASSSPPATNGRFYDDADGDDHEGESMDDDASELHSPNSRANSSSWDDGRADTAEQLLGQAHLWTVPRSGSPPPDAGDRAFPTAVAACLAEPNRITVIAGVNLPLLVKAITHRRGPLEEVTDKLLDGVRETIRTVHALDPDENPG